jgi:hypothetical protein
VKGFGQAGSGTPRERETVANDLDRAGVKRDNNRSAWAERTIYTRRKNRRDDACSRESDLRRNLDRGRRNVEAGWSQGWPPGIAQHDLQTLKGTKPQERLSNDRPVVCPLPKATKAQAVQPIGTDERGKKRTDKERVGQNKLSTLKRKNRKAQARRVSEHQNSPARQLAT